MWRYRFKGYFTIQDESAGLTAKVLNPKPNEKILDACSAPGGKTTYIAELMKNKGEIIAWDIYDHRLKLIEENYKRLGIDIIKTQIKDASIFDEKYVETFDKILLDVPCLGIGVIKKTRYKMGKKKRRYKGNFKNTTTDIRNLFKIFKKRRRTSLFNM